MLTSILFICHFCNGILAFIDGKMGEYRHLFSKHYSLDALYKLMQNGPRKNSVNYHSFHLKPFFLYMMSFILFHNKLYFILYSDKFDHLNLYTLQVYSELGIFRVHIKILSYMCMSLLGPKRILLPINAYVCVSLQIRSNYLRLIAF